MQSLIVQVLESVAANVESPLLSVAFTCTWWRSSTAI